MLENSNQCLNNVIELSLFQSSQYDEYDANDGLIEVIENTELFETIATKDQAVPNNTLIKTIEDAENIELCETIATIATNEIDNGKIYTANSAVCDECLKKDDIIKELRKKLKRATNKIWYMEKIKRKLDAAFTELKQQQILDDKMCETLLV